MMNTKTVQPEDNLEDASVELLIEKAIEDASKLRDEGRKSTQVHKLDTNIKAKRRSTLFKI